MITSSPSPSLHGSAQSSPPSPYPAHRHYNGRNFQALARSQASQSGRAAPPRPDSSPKSTPSTSSVSSTLDASATALPDLPNIAVVDPPGTRRMVDASTQYSPQRFPHKSTQVSFSTYHDNALGMSATTPLPGPAPKSPSLPSQSPMATKRSSSSASIAGTPSHALSSSTHLSTTDSTVLTSEDGSSPKRSRPLDPPAKIMPLRYETCSVRDLVILISSMLMELIRFNDTIPLKDGHLTRFHSRAPPGISVLDYLQRLATHATLSPPILLSMVYYIDRLCALYPAFTISSLTVHRFLITSATVASKGLSDSFWTNKNYARIGGVSLRELALLELEFLWRVEWKIVPQPEVLVDYYMSLVQRSDGYELESPPSTDEMDTGVSDKERGGREGTELQVEEEDR